MPALHERTHGAIARSILDEALAKYECRTGHATDIREVSNYTEFIKSPVDWRPGGIWDAHKTAIIQPGLPLRQRLQARALRWLERRVAYLRRHGRALGPGVLRAALWMTAGVELGLVLSA